jgi:large subunit ribosomal protein L54
MLAGVPWRAARAAPRLARGLAAAAPAKGGAKGGDKKAAAPAAAAEAAKPVEVKPGFLPINVFKAGGDVELKPDAEYPPWLFELLDEMVKDTKAEEVREGITWSTGARRAYKLRTRRAIKANNTVGVTL